MQSALWVLFAIGIAVQARTSRPQNRERHCDGTCQQGEGDCDWDSECLPGLKCKFDWWFGTDVCTAGPTTKNFTWTDWGEWGECLGDRCGSGEVGMRIRIRDCIPPVDGGFDCPSATDDDQETCDMPQCTWSDWSDWSECGGADCGQTGSMSRTRDCSPPADAGYTCPEPNQEEQESCDMPECNCYCPAR